MVGEGQEVEEEGEKEERKEERRNEKLISVLIYNNRLICDYL